jgi:hypothetical protein
MNFNELAVDAFGFMLGASVFIYAKRLASALNRWAARQYVRFPKLKMLPGVRNAGTTMNYRLTFIWLGFAEHSFVLWSSFSIYSNTFPACDSCKESRRILCETTGQVLISALHDSVARRRVVSPD